MKNVVSKETQLLRSSPRARSSGRMRQFLEAAPLLDRLFARVVGGSSKFDWR